jgi:YD repeat-containing protein
MRAKIFKMALAFTAALAAMEGCASDDNDARKADRASGTAPKVHYGYDPLGRLVQAASFDGTGVQYSYDAVGNMTSIRRLSAGTLRVVDFSPASGTPGSTVAVYGSGFSATASENAVSFNGTSTTVASATANALTVNVPPGATTGKISVTNAAGTATSNANFMVLSSTLAPGISAFAPAVATINTVVSVTGVNFQVNPERDKVSSGGQLAKVIKDASSPTGTLLKFKVPSSTASGKIAVTTPFGSVLSSDEIFVVPTEVNPADVEATARVTVGGPPRGVTTTTAGKKIVLVFDAQVGQRLHLLATGGTFAAAFTADVYGSTGAKLQTLTMTNNSVGDFSVPVAVAGTYTIVIKPAASNTGSVQLSVVTDVTGAIAVDGTTPVTLVSGQNARLSFVAQANKGYGLATTGLAFTPSSGSPTPAMAVTLRAADGTSLATCSPSASGSCDFEPASFASAATYFLDFDPNALYAAAFSAVLSADATGSLALDAAPTTVTIARAGQNARYSFAGTAAQLVTVLLSGSTLDDGNASTTSTTQVQVLRSNGSVLASTSFNNFSSGAALDVTLPVTGNYTIAIKPTGVDSGHVDLQVRSPATGTLTVNGSTPISLSPGQNGQYSFAAQASTGYGLAITGLAFTPTSGGPPPMLNVTLRKADGTSPATCSFTSSGSCDLDAAIFTTAGNYMLEFDPNAMYAASFTAVLSSDASGAVTPDASTSTAVTIVRAGQNARYSFAGTAGQAVTVVLSGSTLDDGNASTTSTTEVQVLRPNGSLLVGNSFNNFSSGLALDLTLPDTGSYAILIKPTGLDSGAVNLDVRSVATGALTVDDSTPVSLSAGRNGRFNFTAQAGTGYGLALSSLSFVPGTATPSPAIMVTLRKTDGTSLTTCPFTASGSCDLSPTSFATTGSYLIDFDPNGVVAASFNAVLSTDASGTITIDAPAPTLVTIARAGQNARYSFQGSAGQLVNVVVSGNALDDGNSATVNSTQLAVYKPSSPNTAPIGSGGFNTVTPGFTLNLTLPETGTYAIVISPSGLDAGTFNVGVTHQ